MAKKTTKKTTTKAPAPVATFEKVPTVAPENRRGTSTVENPIGVTWALLLNMVAEEGGVMPARRDMHTAVMGVGVAYYTARTQVQRFRKWYNEGADVAQLPKGVTYTL